MAFLKISWCVCDGQLTAKWSEQPQAQPLASASAEKTYLTDVRQSFTSENDFCSPKHEHGVLRFANPLSKPAFARGAFHLPIAIEPSSEAEQI
jgi:hypothetical protein